MWLPFELVRARWKHNDVVKAFRERIRICREQHKCFDEAQQLPLC
ncbi:hypothetical protein Krac_11243 [Ktedonobacter racemifer DSM 44963]|uniref:Uncharacterized protein n=1 Tax=Ktedonobacter racemifer DSM 44963 TaxID=485913 RepID=D6TJS1_KTERA|nr:hypothetical protein Krac_11243 [Ktedonobacter racemifer DSM 44963]